MILNRRNHFDVLCTCKPSGGNPKQVSGQYSPENSPELSLSPQDRRALANAGANLVVLILLAPLHAAHH